MWITLWIALAIILGLLILAGVGIAVIGWDYVNSEDYVREQLERRYGLRDD